MLTLIEPLLVRYIPNRDIRGLVVGDIVRALLVPEGRRNPQEQERIDALAASYGRELDEEGRRDG